MIQKGHRKPSNLICSGLIAAVLSAGLTFFGGCWDKRELENQAFVQALGVDKSTSGLVVTAMIAVPRNLASGGGGGGGGGGKGSSFVTSIESPSIISALDLFNTYIDRRINLMHNKVIVIGKDMAKEGVDKSLGALMRYREVRRTLYIIVSEGKAADFLKSYQPIMESNAAKWFETMIKSYTYTGLIPNSQYHSFLLAMESESIQPTAILAAVAKPAQKVEEKVKAVAGRSADTDFIAGQTPREGGEPVEMLGTAVFKGNKMVGELSGGETRTLNMLRGEFRRAIMAIKDPIVKGTYVPLEIKQGALPAVKVITAGENPDVRIKLSLEGDILGIQSRENYSTNTGKTAILEAKVKEKIQKEAERLIKKTQSLDTDIIGIGAYAKKKLATWKQWQEYDWPKKYKQASVSVDVSFHVRRIGLQLSQPVPRK